MSSAANSARKLRIGRVSRPHGLKGGLRVTLDHPESSTLDAERQIFLQSASGASRVYTVESVRPLGRGAVWMKLRGIDTCNQAEELRDQTVMIDEASLPPAAAGEFYDYQAIGCEIMTADGQSLGAVKEIFSNGANDVLVVRGSGREVLVPVIADVIKAIDFDARRITIEAVPGLLD